MPSVVISVAASYASSALAGAVGGGILGSLAGAVAGGVISVLSSSIMAKKNKTQSFSNQAQGITQISRSSVDSYKVIYGTRRVSGTLVYVATTDKPTFDKVGGGTGTSDQKNKALHMVVALAGHEVNDIKTIYLDDIPVTLDGSGNVTNSNFISNGTNYLVRIKKHFGADTQLADSSLISEAVEWTENHRLRGIAYLYVRMVYVASNFPNGIPNISAVIEGKKIYDPRSSTTSFSNNWALCVRDYITNSVYGLGASSSEVDDTSFIAAANICDEAVTMQAGGTHARYTCDGIVDTDKNPIDILQDLTSAAAGWISYTQGKFYAFAGAYATPAVTIDESWLKGQIQVSDRPSRKDSFNAVKGVYVEPARLYQPTDFAPITNSTYEAEDGGERIYRDIDLPFTTNQERGQRNAKIFLEQARQTITVEMPCNLKALQLRAGDTVQVNNTALGWVAKIFRVVRWRIAADASVDISLKEEASTVYDWNSGDATLYDSAPDTNLPDPYTVEAPGVPVATEELYVTSDGAGVKTKVTLSWEEAKDAFASRYIVEYKLTSESEYIIAGETRATTMEIIDLAPGSYNWQVKVRSTNGVESIYSTSTSEVFGLTAPPADITGFTLNAINNNAHISWAQATDLDVRIGGKIRLRYTPEVISPSWSSAIDLTDSLSGIATSAVTPLLSGTYMIKAVDSVGNESVNATTISSTVADIITMNFVASGDQHPTFTGSKTSMVVDSSDNTLRLDGAGLFDSSSGNFDDISNFFDVGGGGGFETSGSYNFVDTIDLGAIYTSRVTAAIDALVYDATTTFDETATNFDAGSGQFDGDDISTVQASLYVRTTDGDPSGSPTWSGWRSFFVGDYTARAFQFKVDVTSANIAHNIAISELSVTVDMPDKVQSAKVNVTGTSVATAITFPTSFKVSSPAIGWALQDGASGDYCTVENVTAGGFDLNVYNSSAVRIARNVVWTAKGY